jgi:hypothetical protein
VSGLRRFSSKDVMLPMMLLSPGHKRWQIGTKTLGIIIAAIIVVVMRAL